MDEIKPCPFCASTDIVVLERENIECSNCGEFHFAKTWNTRPIEDAQATRIAELEAQLAAVPRWTRITDDPATWPPVNSGYVLSIAPNGYDLTPSSLIRDVPGMYTYWLPITPPQVES